MAPPGNISLSCVSPVFELRRGLATYSKLCSMKLPLDVEGPGCARFGYDHPGGYERDMGGRSGYHDDRPRGRRSVTRVIFSNGGSSVSDSESKFSSAFLLCLLPSSCGALLDWDSGRGGYNGHANTSSVLNIGATTLVTQAATTIFGEAGVSAATGVMTVRPIAWLSLFLYPIRRVVTYLSMGMLKLLVLKGRSIHDNHLNKSEASHHNTSGNNYVVMILSTKYAQVVFILQETINRHEECEDQALTIFFC
ncbi:hypothetical protein Tco_0658213 [Tanacetum coccineum]